jgi:hypothetical protein
MISLALTYKKTCNNVAMEYVYAPLFPTTTLKVEKHVWFIYSFFTLLCVWSSIGRIFDFCNNQWFWLFKYLKVRKLTVSSLQKNKNENNYFAPIISKLAFKKATSFMKLGQFFKWLFEKFQLFL